MTVVCPICKGEKVCIHHNGVDPQKSNNELKTCWMCKGSGQVEEVRHNRKLHITKYWQVEDSV